MTKKKHKKEVIEPSPMQDEIRLTERQLSKFWSIAPETLRRWRILGQGPIYLKAGGRVLYRPEDIREFERQMLYRSPSERIQSKGGRDGEEK